MTKIPCNQYCFVQASVSRFVCRAFFDPFARFLMEFLEQLSPISMYTESNTAKWKTTMLIEAIDTAVFARFECRLETNESSGMSIGVIAYQR